MNHPGFNRIFEQDQLTVGLVLPVDRYPVGGHPNIAPLTELAQLAETLGFGALWLRDIPFEVPSFGDVGQMLDPFVCASWLAAHTREITLASGSLILPLRHPALTAKSAASIDLLSGGRWIMGVASGDRPEEFPAMGRSWESRGEAFRQHLDYLRDLSDDFPQLENQFGRLDGGLNSLPKSHFGLVPLAFTGGCQQHPDFVAQHTDSWITYPRPPSVQAQVVEDFRNRTSRFERGFVPISQSLYIDLVDRAPSQPIPIHLGWRLSIDQLLDLLRSLKHCGINHVALNLRFSSLEIKTTLGLLAERLFPEFGIRD